MIASQVVDWASLGKAVLDSVVIGLAVLVVAGFAVVASLRSQDESAAGRDGAALGLRVLTAVCVIGLAGAIAAGIWAMSQ